MESFLPRGCPRGIYAGLASLSEGCPPVEGRLHTCYSPVRRSPAGKASFPPAAPRLACVKPAASVHPEPGSNSPLLVSCTFCFVCLSVARLPKVLRIDRDNQCPLFFSLTSTAETVALLCPVAKCQCSIAPGNPPPLLSVRLPGRGCFPVCGCKVIAILNPVQIFFVISFIFPFLFRLTYCLSAKSINVKIYCIVLIICCGTSLSRHKFFTAPEKASKKAPSLPEWSRFL